MKAIIRSACVAFVLQWTVMATTASASTTVLLSLSGTVGDANWTVGSPADADPSVQYPELAINLDPFLEKFGAPGGLIQITYSGPALLVTNTDYYYLQQYEFYDCLQSHCTSFADLTHDGGDDLGPFSGPDHEFFGDSSYSFIIDTSYINRSPIPPPDVPIEDYANRWIYRDGYTFYTVNNFVSADDIGKAYSFTISTVPEPATWAMMLAGFGLIGAAMRAAKGKRPASNLA